MIAWPPGATREVDRNHTHYVILGCGFSALTNHVTLRANSRDRIGELPILHIGGPDPWKTYAPLAMGQWPALLTLPGFTNRPNAADHTFLKSDQFSEISAREWADLGVDHPFYAVDAQVTAIREVPSAGYELKFSDESQPIIAAKLDICGGPGPPLRPAPSLVSDPILIQEFDSGEGTSLGWARLLSGERFLQADTPSGARVVVVGGGPTGAWVVERAQRLGCSVLWISSASLSPAFLASRRNDHLARAPLFRSKDYGSHTTVVDGPLWPARRKTRFGEYLLVSRIEIASDGSLELRLQPSFSHGLAPRMVDSSGEIGIPAEIRCDQVVICFGQAKDSHQTGSWASMVDPLLATSRNRRKHLLKDRAGRVIGLASHDGRLRIMGAAALNHPEVRSEWRLTHTPSFLYLQSLVEQSKVEIGIALAAVLTAEANRYFTAGSPNRNINTNFVDDLRSSCPQLDLVMASSWEEMRSVRTTPFTASEFTEVLGASSDRY